MHLQKILLFTLFITISFSAFSQSEVEPITIGEKYFIKSEILNEDREVLVYTPRDYEENEDKLPVMYLLDGWGNFHHTTACVRFLEKNGRIPQMIVIGIPNTNDRTRDLTPPLQKPESDFPSAGGADNMLKFITDELVPFVNENYRTLDYKMLVGHSFGGLFATHVLVNHPGFFDSYLSISPSLWWDNQNLVKNQTDQFFENNKQLKGHLYMTMGNEGGTMLGGAWKLSALLKEKSLADFHWEFDRMIEETHGSIPHLSTYKGLEWIFEDWNFNKQKEKFLVGGADAIEKFEKEVNDLYGFPPKMEERDLGGIANLILENGSPAKAAEIFKMVIDKNPNNSRAWLKYGESCLVAGDKEKAVSIFSEMFEKDTNNIAAIVKLKSLGEDMSEVLPDVNPSRKQLAQYAGKYNFQDQQTFQLTTSDGKLYMEEDPGSGNEPIELFAIGKDRYYYTKEQATVEFQWQDKKVTGFKAFVEGKIIEIEKIKP